MPQLLLVAARNYYNISIQFMTLNLSFVINLSNFSNDLIFSDIHLFHLQPHLSLTIYKQNRSCVHNNENYQSNDSMSQALSIWYSKQPEISYQT